MKNILISLPIILPLFTAIIQLMFWKKIKIQRAVYLVSSIFLLAIAGYLLYEVSNNGIIAQTLGNWSAPFGIALVADVFSGIMLNLGALMSFSVALYSFYGIDEKREKFGYYPLLQTLMMGVNGAFLTGDIFNLYVWFEVMLISSFVLIALGGEKSQLEGAIKYVTLNLISSSLFLTGIGILYGLMGTLNMADLAVNMYKLQDVGLATIVSMIFLVAFGIKAAVFPLFFWLPASYHTPPIPIAAIFAGLLTKVGVYALIRVFTLIFTNDPDFTHSVILAIAAFTMIVGVLGAAAQNEIRRILSFHIVSQIGYMIMGLGLFTKIAIVGSVFYIIHHIIVKTNLFLIGGAIHRLKGTTKLAEIEGLYRKFPYLAILFLIPALSLAGIPPLSGFWAKFTLIKAGLEVEQYLIVAAALVVGLLTLFSMTKIWGEAFWKDNKLSGEKETDERQMNFGEKVSFYSPIIFLAALTLFIGFYGEPIFALAIQASDQILDNSEYINAVLGVAK